MLQNEGEGRLGRQAIEDNRKIHIYQIEACQALPVPGPLFSLLSLHYFKDFPCYKK